MRALVTYVDSLGDVGAAAEADSVRAASIAAWASLVARYSADVALSEYRQTITLLPEGAHVRYVVERASITDPRQVCSYGRLRTARAAVDALVGQTEHLYVVVAEVNA